MSGAPCRREIVSASYVESMTASVSSTPAVASTEPPVWCSVCWPSNKSSDVDVSRSLAAARAEIARCKRKSPASESSGASLPDAESSRTPVTPPKVLRVLRSFSGSYASLEGEVARDLVVRCVEVHLRLRRAAEPAVAPAHLDVAAHLRFARSSHAGARSRAIDHRLAAGAGLDVERPELEVAGASPTASRCGGAEAASGDAPSTKYGALPMRSSRHSIASLGAGDREPPPPRRLHRDALDERVVVLGRASGQAPAQRGRERAALRGVTARTSVGSARSSRSRTAAYSAACSAGATSSNQSAPGARPWPPVSSRSKRCCGDAFTTIRDRYLQLTRYTWSTRRSAGTTSSPGERCAPFHSTLTGGRPRSASRAARNALAVHERRRRTVARAARRVQRVLQRVPVVGVDVGERGRPRRERGFDVVDAAACRAR